MEKKYILTHTIAFNPNNGIVHPETNIFLFQNREDGIKKMQETVDNIKNGECNNWHCSEIMETKSGCALLFLTETGKDILVTVELRPMEYPFVTIN